MPTPGKNEKKEDFIDRCIPIVITDGTAKDGSQATAICYSIWEQSKKKKESAMYLKEEDVERRCLPAAELRIADDSPKITGYAAVFNTWADIGGWFRESIKPGAFAKTIREADVRALWNHDPNYVLARNKAGTLRLSEDAKGLAVEIDPVDSLWANDLVKSMKRGDVNQMSFGFTVNKEEIDPMKDERVLVDVSLFDVSVVAFPAYPTTNAQVRSLFRKDADSTPPPHPFVIEPPTTPPPGFSELDRIIRKVLNKEELTEEEWRVVASHYPDLSPPAASHAETPTPPAASHAVVDTRADKWTALWIKAERIAPSAK